MRTKKCLLTVMLLCVSLAKLSAFWVVNFGTASTLMMKKFGFAAGMGGQMVFLGNPRSTSAFFTIPHAGFRYGLGKSTDIGLRLAPVPLPFASVGPGFGVNLDVKHCFTAPGKKFDFAIVLGAGAAHVLIEQKNRSAYSLNTALLGSFHLKKATQLTIMARQVHIGIPTAIGGKTDNNVNILGCSVGLKKNIRNNIAILPEIGIYNYKGKLNGVDKNGPGFQYGLMISTSF
jgi:hypothetical protein